ncbi:MAG: helix-turn-helix domain-containing protein [Pseudomonadota bacterium]
MARTYNQECILAHALDLLGERWTFLIIRDLFLGPQRFGDLQATLPGIGANLLSKRLKELTEAGLIEAPDATGPNNRYRLTEYGEGLRPTIRNLMRWSVHYFKTRTQTSPAKACIYSDDLMPDTVALAIELFSDDVRDESLNYVAHAYIDDYPYTLFYMNGQMTARRGVDAPAVACLSGSVADLMKALRYDIDTEEARRRLKLEGDPRATEHLLKCISHLEHQQVEALDVHEHRIATS